MKAVVVKDNLKEGLFVVGRVPTESSQLPILKNVLIETSENKLVIAATNLEIAVKFYISGKIIENGALAAPIGVLSNIISNISSERINLWGKKNIFEIKTDNYHAQINSSPSDDFPIIPKIKNQGGYIETDSELLKESLSQVTSASQFSELRPELNSVFVDYSIDCLKFVSTDSFRLAEKSLNPNQINSTIESPFSLLIPLRSCQELMRILGNDGAVKIFFDDSQILFKSDKWELFSRLLEGSFPDYKQVVPKKYGAETTMLKDELVSGIKLSSIFSSKNNEVKIKILEGKKNIEISSSDQTTGENKFVLPARINGSVNEISFNWKYLGDGLKAISSEEVMFGFSDDNKPAVIKSPKDDSFFYLIMPILKA